jgi:hypothetical protein
MGFSAGLDVLKSTHNYVDEELNEWLMRLNEEMDVGDC